MDVDQLTASNFRRLREEKGWSQEALAAEVRERLGLDWTRDHVAAVERGARRLSVGELLALGYLFGNSLDEFFDGVKADEWIELTEGFRARNLAYALRDGRVTDVDGPREREYAAREAALTPEQQAERAARQQAEQKAAKALGTYASSVAFAALRLWKATLTAERDRRVAERAPADASPRALQALRGHITRELYEELRPVLKSGRGRKKAVRK